jgi:membrane carboxypeptidase/penicillin-binding protein PbpC
MNGKPGDYEDKIIEVWPPDIESYLRKNGKKTDMIPKHNPECSAINESKGLKIKNPLKNGFYMVSKALSPAEQKIALKAESNSNAGEIYWLVDDNIIASGLPDKTYFMEPKLGKHTITVKNLNGQYDTVEIQVLEEASALNCNN